MATPCVMIFVDGNEVKIRARDLKALFPSTPIFIKPPHPHRRSQIFDIMHIYNHH